MPKIICTLPNASELINDVKFVTHALGRISEEVSEEVASFFESIPGYERAFAAAPVIEITKDELLARAAKVNLTVKGNWGLQRLKTEVEGAEEDVAEALATAGKQTTEVPSGVDVKVSGDAAGADAK